VISHWFKSFRPDHRLAVLGLCGCENEKRQPRLWLPFAFVTRKPAHLYTVVADRQHLMQNLHDREAVRGFMHHSKQDKPRRAWVRLIIT